MHDSVNIFEFCIEMSQTHYCFHFMTLWINSSHPFDSYEYCKQKLFILNTKEYYSCDFLDVNFITLENTSILDENCNAVIFASVPFSQSALLEGNWLVSFSNSSVLLVKKKMIIQQRDDR